MAKTQQFPSRRTLLGTVGASLLAGMAFAQAVPPQGGTMSAPDAHALARSGDITLIDIRRPDEWAQTGSGEGAHRLDMRRQDFVPELLKILSGDTDTPIAIICARGVRSKWLTAALINAGLTHVIDVPEGMVGSNAGPGWVARGLPLVKG